MTRLNIAHQRLHNQHIASAIFEKPGDLVQWLGAVQAQDYAAAKWALGLRSQGVIDGQIVGTWKRTLKKDTVVIEAQPFTPLSEAETRAVAIAAERYGRFLGTPATLHI